MLGLSLPLLLVTPVATTTASIPTERLTITTSRPLSWLQTPAATSYRSLAQYSAVPDAAAMLQGIAGLQADARSNLAQDSKLSIRGFGSRSAFGVRSIRLTLDGIPLTTIDGQSQPSSLLTADLASVEVLKGPFAALHGNAGGGVIALTSRSPEPGTVRFSTLADANQQLQQLWLDGSNSSLALQNFHSDGQRPWNTAKRQQAAFKQQLQISEQVRWNWRYDYHHDHRLDDPGSLTLAQWQANPQQTIELASRFNSHKTGRQQQLATSLSGRDWQLSAWQQQRDIRQFLPQSGEAIGASGGVVDLARQFRGVEWRHNVDWQQLNWQWSARLQQGEDRRLGFVNRLGVVGDVRRDELNRSASQELALQLNYPLSVNWQSFAGARTSQQRYRIEDFFVVAGNPDDSGRTQFSDQSHALGLLYQQDDWSWYLSTGVGFETPTLTEMAYRRDGQGPNLQLTSNEFRQWDSGLKKTFQWQQRRILLQLDLFRIDSSDELMIDTNINGRTTYRNGGNTRRHGAELSFTAEQDDWRFDYQANAINARALLSAGAQPLPGIADLTQWAQLSWTAGNTWQSQLQLEWQASSAIPVAEQNSLASPAYRLWHLNATVSPDWFGLQWQLLLRLQNLTDEPYAATVVVNQAGGRYIEPGSPRQLSAGIRVSFQLF